MGNNIPTIQKPAFLGGSASGHHVIYTDIQLTKVHEPKTQFYLHQYVSDKIDRSDQDERISDIISQHLAHDYNIDLLNDDNRTPLMLAIMNPRQRGSDLHIEILLNKGANPNIITNDGETPLHLSLKYARSLKIIKLLLEHNADIYISPNDKNQCALMLAVVKPQMYYMTEDPHFENRDIIVHKILDVSQDINRVDKDGNTALHLCCKQNKKDINIDILEILLRNEADINAQNKRGETPLMLAVKSESIRVTMILIGAGANLKLMDNNFETVFHKAIRVK